MKRPYLFFIVMLFAIILILPVIGSAESNQGNAADNIPPISEAGEDMDAVAGEPFVLDGSGSSDPDGFIPIFNWTQIEGPQVALYNSFGATAYFDAPLVENDTKLVFELLVVDNQTARDHDEVEITVTVPSQREQAPIAKAGPDITVSEGDRVVLDGSDSTDPDGVIVQYQWRQIDGPSVVINQNDKAAADFNAPSADNETILIFELNITDNTDRTDSDHILVTVESSSGSGDKVAYKKTGQITLGPWPEGVAATLDHAYFADSVNLDILIAKIPDNNEDISIIGTIPLGKKPYGIAATPDGRHLYIGHDNSLSIIRTSDNRPINDISLPQRVSIVTISPDGNYAYAGHDTSASLNVIRTWDQKLIKVVQINGRIGGIAATAEYVYVTDLYNNRVLVIRTADYSIVGALTVGLRPGGIAVTPDGQYLYVAIGSEDLIDVVRTYDYSLITSFVTGKNPVEVAVSPEGNTVFATISEDGNVSLIRTSENNVYNNISVQKRPTKLAITPNGDYVFVLNADEKTASVIKKTIEKDDDDSCFISSISMNAFTWNLIGSVRGAFDQN